MSATGVKRAKLLGESETAEPKLIYEGERDRREWQARRILLLWSTRGIPLRVFLVCALASMTIPFFIPNSYMATSQLMPPENTSNSNMAMLATITSKASPLGGVATDLLNSRTSAGLFIGVLTSQKIQSQLVSQFHLIDAYQLKEAEEAQAKLNENTFAREDKNSGLITISVTDRDAQRAAALANAYVDRLNLLLAQLSTSSARKERVFLEDRLKLVKQDLDNATNQLARFSSSTDTLDPQQESKAVLETAGNITAQLIASESQLEGLRQIYTDRHPRLKALTARVEALRKELAKLGGASGTADGQKNKDANNAGHDSPSAAYPSMKSLPLLGAKYADYYRHLRIQESVFEMLTTQYELAKVQEAKEIPSVKILDAATPPRKKISPNRPLLMMLGLLLSFGVATACWLVTMLWQEVDPLDPRLMAVQGLLGGPEAYISWFPEGKERQAPASRRETIFSRLRKGHVHRNDQASD